MSRWYRAYEGTVTDAKLAEVALVAGCSRSVVIATWHAVLENAATVNDGGRIDVPSRRIAAVLCEPFETIEAVMLGFETVGMITDSSVAAWKRRQYESDSSTERSRKHRERKRNSDATPVQRCATPPETETDIPLSNDNGASKSDKEFWDSAKAYVGRSKASKIGQWVRDFGKPETAQAITAAQLERAVDPVAYIEKTLRNGKARASPAFSSPC